MNSRYDFMEPSKVLDTDGDCFPDCLTTNYINTKITTVPAFYNVSEGDIQKPWAYMMKIYGVPYYDDILYNMNRIPYVNIMSPGYTVANFSINDLTKFNTQKLKEDD